MDFQGSESQDQTSDRRDLRDSSVSVVVPVVVASFIASSVDSATAVVAGLAPSVAPSIATSSSSFAFSKFPSVAQVVVVAAALIGCHCRLSLGFDLPQLLAAILILLVAVFSCGADPLGRPPGDAWQLMQR